MMFRDSGNVNKIRAMTRFHFIAGLPGSGASVLSAILSQNPRFVAPGTSPACKLFESMVQLLTEEGRDGLNLNSDQKIALWRGVFDAVYHDRPIDSVVFDGCRDWLNYTDLLVRLFPLSRFILCVRNPAAIANSLEHSGQSADIVPDEQTVNSRLRSIMARDGYVGTHIRLLRLALKGQQTERMIVVDYDRLVDDPDEVMDVLYDFLREPVFEHDFDNLSLALPAIGLKKGQRPRVVSGAVRRSNHHMHLPARTVRQLSGKAFWRNLRKTNATMMLGRMR